jgi:hypothetical protein
MKALILDEKVLEVQENAFPVHPSLVWIDCDDSVKGGDTYKDSKFSRVEPYIRPPIDTLRNQRNRLLAETDWMANKDVTLTTAWKTYRQELRDLPAGLDTVEKVNAVTWPTKPS